MERLGEAMSCYQKAWNLPGDSIPRTGPSPHSNTTTTLTRKAMWAWTSSACYSAEVQVPAFLIVQRLLSYLLGEKEENPRYHHRTNLLLANDETGLVRDLIVSTPEEGLQGLYLDPIAVGLTLMDDALLKSVKAGWCSLQGDSETSATGQNWKIKPTEAIRLEPDVSGLFTLSGGSAGGLFSAVPFAAAHHLSLDTGASASIQVLVPDNRPCKQLTPHDLEYKPVSSETIHLKLSAAQKHQRVPRIAVHEDQEGIKESDTNGLTIVHPKNLGQITAHLTGNTKYERIIEQYCQKVCNRWESWTVPPELLPSDHPEHRLDHYIDPHYALLPKELDFDKAWMRDTSEKPEAGSDENEEQTSNHYRRVEPEEGETELVTLIRKFLIHDEEQMHRHLCLTEDAGSGKSVFSLKLQQTLSSEEGRKLQQEEQPWLAIRIEQWVWLPEKSRYATLEEMLMMQLKTLLTGIDETLLKETLDYALEQRRVVLILDALDQQMDQEVIQQQLIPLMSETSELGKQLRLVITSRAHSVRERQKTLFKTRDQWHYAILELFDEEQQNDYLRDLSEDHVKALLPNNDYLLDLPEGRVKVLLPDRELVAELLQFPVVLKMIRTLIEEHRLLPETVPLVPFRYRGDLYWRVSLMLIQRAFKKLAAEGGTTNVEDRHLLEVLSCIAFEMMIRQFYNYTIPQGNIDDVVNAAYKRFSIEGPTKNQLWINALKFLKQTHLTDRAILEAESNEHLGFRSRKMMEFFAALHMARCASKDSSKDALPFINEEDWYWPWRFAIELPLMERPGGSQKLKPFDREKLCHSLGLLLRRPEKGRRPTEHIWRAWYLFEYDEFRVRELGFQDAKGKPLTGDALKQKGEELLLDETARQEVLKRFRGELKFWQSLPDDDNWKEKLNKKWNSKKRREFCPESWKSEFQKFERSPNRIVHDLLKGFVTCPPKDDRYPDPKTDPRRTFMMGDPGKQVKVTITREIAIQNFPVTREQHRLFDALHEQTATVWWTYTPVETILESHSYETDSERCPVLGVSWSYAFVFSKWMGPAYRLLTEAEWEWACRAETITEYAFGDQLTKEHANFGSIVGHTTPAGRYSANDWKLYDMHGNVWEWCFDWHGLDLPGGVDPIRTEESRGRVGRGGSWDYDSRYCRSAYHTYEVPGDLSSVLGFRICSISSDPLS